MAKTNAFKLAELIRVFQYDSSNDVITTSKRTEDKNKKRGNATKTATDQFALDPGHDWTQIWIIPAIFAAVVLVIFILTFKNEKIEIEK